MHVKKPCRVYKERIMLIKGGCDALNEVAERQNADINCECNAIRKTMNIKGSPKVREGVFRLLSFVNHSSPTVVVLLATVTEGYLGHEPRENRTSSRGT